MEPFGQDNPSISLLIEGANVKDYSTMGKDKNHYRASFVKNNEGIKSVGFFSSLSDGASSGNMMCDVVVTPSINSFNGYQNVQGMINGVKTYYQSEDGYIKYLDSIEHKFTASAIESSNFTDGDDIEFDTITTDELRNVLLNTSYQNLVIVDDINIAKGI